MERGSDKFAAVDWLPAPSGTAVLVGAPARIDCTVEAVLDGDDHRIVLDNLITWSSDWSRTAAWFQRRSGAHRAGPFSGHGRRRLQPGA